MEWALHIFDDVSQYWMLHHIHFLFVICFMFLFKYSIVFRVQEVQKRKFDPITAIIRDTLHWLQVTHRILFKLHILVYKSLHDSAVICRNMLCSILSTSIGSTYRQLRLLKECYMSQSPKLPITATATSVSPDLQPGTSFHLTFVIPP